MTDLFQFTIVFQPQKPHGEIHSSCLWIEGNVLFINPLNANIPKNGQTHSNYSSPTADELFDCV